MPSSLNGTGVTFNDGTQLQSANDAGGDYVLKTFTAPGTYAKPAGLKAVKVTVIGGGGGGGNKPAPLASTAGTSGGGGAGGAIAFIPAASIPGPVTVTVGAGGAAATAGGTSSFSTFATATGGAAGRNAPAPLGDVAGGVGTTALGLAITGGRGSSAVISFLEQAGGGQGAILGISNQTTRPGTPNENGRPATGFGSGGRGANGPAPQPARSGGTGSPGLVIVEEFY